MKYPGVDASTKAVEEGWIKFHPERWTKTYTHWMRGIKDWCISRQLWWGHRVPVWRKKVQADETTRKLRQGSKLVFEALSEHLKDSGQQIEQEPLIERNNT